MKDFNKEFKEWYFQFKVEGWGLRKTGMNYFCHLPFSMQWGVYLAFFDSVGINIYTMPITTLGSGKVEFFCEIGDIETEGHLTREEAQKEAVKKAIEIYEK